MLVAFYERHPESRQDARRGRDQLLPPVVGCAYDAALNLPMKDPSTEIWCGRTDYCFLQNSEAPAVSPVAHRGHRGARDSDGRGDSLEGSTGRRGYTHLSKLGSHSLNSSFSVGDANPYQTLSYIYTRGGHVSGFYYSWSIYSPLS